MAGPKTRKKLTKPGGFTYAQAKVFDKIARWQTKKGIGVVSLAEYISKGMPSFDEYEKIYSKHKGTAEKRMKEHDKKLKKAKVKSIQRKLKKKD